MVGLVEAHVMMCIAGDCNGHVGKGNYDGGKGIERVESW